jgi:hypothetical protein
MLSENDIFKACRILFGDQIDVGQDFLFYIQPCGARSAYRRLAKETHPDLFLNETPDVLKNRTEQFKNLNEAYELLSTFFIQREQGLILSSSDVKNSPSTVSSRPKNSASRSHSSSTHNQKNRFYNGKIPTRICKIGIYLYYRGLIPFRALIEALVWQRRQRPSIGQLAHRWGWLEDSEINKIITSRKYQGLFGEKAVDMGLLTEFQVRTLLYFQGTLHKKLGQYFVEKGSFSPGKMEKLVKELHGHNARVIQKN